MKFYEGRFMPQDGPDTAQSANDFLVREWSLRYPPFWSDVVLVTEKYIHEELEDFPKGYSLPEVSNETVEKGIRRISNECVSEHVPFSSETRSVARVVFDLSENFPGWRLNSNVPPDGHDTNENLLMRGLLLDAYSLGALASFARVRRNEMLHAGREAGVSVRPSYSQEAITNYWEYVSWVTEIAWRESVAVERLK